MQILVFDEEVTREEEKGKVLPFHPNLSAQNRAENRPKRKQEAALRYFLKSKPLLNNFVINLCPRSRLVT